MKSFKVLIMNDENGEIEREVYYCNNLTSKENLINCVSFYEFFTVLTNKELKEKVENKIIEKQRSYNYQGNKYNYFIRK